ncbi:MAG: DUF4974 domain-containing protein [Planctomycetota bacterium]|nr:DUF4974 domain-containing protein [Planctomycetota bacterium]
MWQTDTVRSSWLSCVILALVWTATSALELHAAGPWPSVGQNDSAAEKTIAQALGAPTRLEFVETPLEDVMAFLRDQHNITIEIDKKALDNVGIGTDTPITKNLKDVSLRSALRLILRDLGLTYVTDHEVLTITSQDEAAANPQVRIYNVAAFASDDISPEELAGTLQQILTSTPKASAAGSEMPGCCSGPCPGGGEAVRPADSAPSALRIIPLKQVLVIRATTEGHGAVANLLGALAESLKGSSKK